MPEKKHSKRIKSKKIEDHKPLLQDEENKKEACDTDNKTSIESAQKANEEERTSPPPQEVVQPPQIEEPSPSPQIEEESPYCIECYFDGTAKNYVATITEFSDIRVTGSSRINAIEAVLNKLEERLSAMRQRGEQLPDPLNFKQYPSTLNVAISQGLYKKLDKLSYLEKLDIDRLTSELLSEAIENRYDTLMSRKEDKRYPQQQNRYQPRGGMQTDKIHGRNYHQTMQNRENFLEYVRSLEKSSRTNPRDWKKR